MTNARERRLAKSEVERLREVEAYARDALTILEKAHYPPFDQTDSPDAIAVMDGLRPLLYPEGQE